MTVRINGTETIRNVTVRLNSDGRILTMIGKDPDRTVGEFAQLLAGQPTIEVLDGQRVTAMYIGVKLMTLTMEVIGGILTITASIQVNTLSQDTADELRQTIALQEAAIAEQDKEIAQLGETVADQATVIGAQAERITAQDKQIAAQTEQIAAQTGKIEQQEKALIEMDKAVTEAQKASGEAMEALEAIEEGIANA